MGSKQTLVNLLFHLIVGTVTSLILSGVGIVILLLSGFNPNNGFFLILEIFSFGWIFLFLMLGLFASRGSRESSLLLIGIIPGRLIGMLAGGLAGSRLSGTAGAIFGALILYFVGRWSGPKISRWVATWVEPRFPVAWGGNKTQITDPKRLKKVIAIGYFFLTLPFIGFVVGSLLLHLEINAFPEAVPIARVLLLVFSFVVIFYVAALELNLSFVRFQLKPGVNPITLYFLKLTFLFAILIYGLIMFMLGSVLDFFVFALISLVSMAGFVFISFRPKTAAGAPTQ